VPEVLTGQTLIEAGFAPAELDGSWQPYRAQGCQACNRGYKGRVGVHQVMPVSDEIQRIILRDGSATEIAAQAQSEGVNTLRQSGLRKVKLGLTSLQEILSCTNA
jgi:type IV pilus assembly protein PilB